MEPDEFFNLASYIYPILNTPPSLLSSEILRRTYVNRVYYFLYHLTKNETLKQLNTFKNLPKWLNEDRISPEDLFREHKLLRRFYQNLYDETEHNEARQVLHILNRYNTYRVLADYYIETNHPQKGRHQLNFQNPLKTPYSWKELNLTNIEKRKNNIISNIQTLFSTHLKDKDTLLYNILRDLK